VYEQVKRDSAETDAMKAEVVAILARQISRLRVALQDALSVRSGPEEGSDAWLLLNAFVSNDYAEYISHFEQSGRALAEQGGKLETRLQGLQVCVDALASECKLLFAAQPQFQFASLSQLLQLHSAILLALTRGYQSVIESVIEERREMGEYLERRLQTLQRINSISNSAMDQDQTLEMTAQKVAEELGVDLCSIFFYDELQRMLTLRATNGPRPLGGMHYVLRMGEGYSGWVADKGRPLLVHDTLAEPAFAVEARVYGPEYRGLMALPIIFFGNVERLIGVVSVQTTEPREFSGEEINFLEVVAGIIAINNENGRLYEQTDEQLRRKVHELATMHRVTSIIASTLDLDRVLQIITTQAVQLSGAERSCIFELDPAKKHLDVLAHYGLHGADVSGIHVPVGQCCAGRAVLTGEATRAIDCLYSDEKCFLRQDPMVSSDIHSVLCVPLRVKSKVLGCICIYSSHRHLLSSEQMQLIVTFANEAAIAIDNARLYEETRRGLELKSVLLRELHHRVKNNLATVAGILSLQRRRTKSPEVRYILAESVNRVQGLAATHDLLSHEDVGEARVDDIARKIVGVANANMRPPETHITFEVEPCEIVIPSRAVAILALVLNEIVSNAMKHGMKGMSEGKITVRGSKERGQVVVAVYDTGKGPSGSVEEEEATEGLGLSLIRNMIGDLRGQFTLRRTEETPPRTCAEVRFPLEQSSS
jgi:two-component sensor histidine kinase/putative methionine-R-sulfoxide reductase with GAF domain